MFSAQITELRKFILNLDERIQQYEKIGRSTDRLKENRARALHTIEELKQAENSNGIPSTHQKIGP